MSNDDDDEWNDKRIRDFRSCTIAEMLFMPKKCFARRCRKWGECKINGAPCLRYQSNLAWRRLDGLIGRHPHLGDSDDEDEVDEDDDN